MGNHSRTPPNDLAPNHPKCAQTDFQKETQQDTETQSPRETRAKGGARHCGEAGNKFPPSVSTTFPEEKHGVDVNEGKRP